MRAALGLAAVVAGFLVVVPGAAGTVAADPPASSSCTTTAPMALGAAGQDVACLQFLLGLGGYYDGELTSHYDQTTADAVAAYQSAHPPLVATGTADADTLTAMGIGSAPAAQTTAAAPACTADANLPAGARGDGVACIQRRLAALGLFSDTADGVLGPSTVAAVKAFQAKSPPLAVDGLAGPSTLAALGLWSGHSGTATANPNAAVATPTPQPEESTVDAAPMGPWPAPALDFPNWNRTADGIPYYGASTPCSVADANTIASQFALNGADVSTQQWAVYIASREGGCRYAAVNINPATRDDSHCTFQLNALSGMFTPHGELGRLGWTTDNVKASMAACADAASDLWVYCGKGPWTKPYRCLQPWENDLGAVGDQ